MATGHIIPGYGKPVARLKRAQTAYPMDSGKLREIAARNVPSLDQSTLDAIRANARNAWMHKDREPTTYNSFHRELLLDEPTQGRPTSPSRRHKPHPKPVFLINRLHYVPGYHNPDATMGKEVYRVDDSFPEEERQWRRQAREKYVPRPSSAAVDQYNEPYAPLRDALGPVEAWGAQAWLKTADDDNKHGVMNAVQNYREKELFRTGTPVPPVPDASPRPHTAIPSMNRWLKMAGANESEHVQRVAYGHYPPSTVQPLGNIGYPSTTLQRKKQELYAMNKSRYIHKPIRGDFLIHPEWPPTFIHHRID